MFLAQSFASAAIAAINFAFSFVFAVALFNNISVPGGAAASANAASAATSANAAAALATNAPPPALSLPDVSAISLSFFTLSTKVLSSVLSLMFSSHVNNKDKIHLSGI